MLSYALFSGLALGGMYALIAMGLTLQYGVSRVMNLAYGEFLVVACFATYGLTTVLGVSPILALPIVVPVAFGLSWGVYRWLLLPLVKRAKNQKALEVDSILATFGLLFLVQGFLLVGFGGLYYSYDFLNEAVDVFGMSISMNRLVALGVALVIGVGFFLLLTRTRLGTALRAVAAAPESAPLVAIDLNFASCFAFALGAPRANV